MNFKDIIKRFIYPPLLLLWILIPISAVMLAYSFSALTTDSPISIVSYVISAYTLTVWCFRIPDVIAFFKAFKKENRLILILAKNERLRIILSLSLATVPNIAYATLLLGLGFYHRSFWYSSLAGYYFCLGIMRLYLSLSILRAGRENHLSDELKKYRLCGYVMLLINLSVAFMMFFMIYFDRGIIHHEITTIALAAFTFASLTLSILGAVRYRKYKSPMYSAAKSVGLASAAVSMLTLTSAMLNAFGSRGEDLYTDKGILFFSGCAVSAFIITLALYMIISSSKSITKIKNQETL